MKEEVLKYTEAAFCQLTIGGFGKVVVWTLWKNRGDLLMLMKEGSLS